MLLIKMFGEVETDKYGLSEAWHLWAVQKVSHLLYCLQDKNLHVDKEYTDAAIIILMPSKPLLVLFSSNQSAMNESWEYRAVVLVLDRKTNILSLVRRS